MEDNLREPLGMLSYQSVIYSVALRHRGVYIATSISLRGDKESFNCAKET